MIANCGSETHDSKASRADEIALLHAGLDLAGIAHRFDDADNAAIPPAFVIGRSPYIVRHPVAPRLDPAVPFSTVSRYVAAVANLAHRAGSKKVCIASSKARRAHAAPAQRRLRTTQVAGTINRPSPARSIGEVSARHLLHRLLPSRAHNHVISARGRARLHSAAVKQFATVKSPPANLP